MGENSNIQNSIFEAMKIFSDSAVSKSNATITIEGKITSVEDSAAGTYSVEYLGSTLTVHSSSNATYSVGDNVYVLIPDGDFSKEKIIIGLISPSAKIYTNRVENTKSYYDITDNLIGTAQDVIKLNSHKTVNKNENKIDIVDHDAEAFGAMIEEYLKEGFRTFRFEAEVKTVLDVDRQVGGSYGVTLNIPIIKDSESGYGETVSAWETIDLGSSVFNGNPYRQTDWTPQSIYFTLNSKYQYDATRTPYYSCYCYGFPQDETEEYDIFLNSLSFNVVREMTDEDISGYSLTLHSSEGDCFTAFTSEEKTIIPTLRVNGKVTSLDKAKIYWFLKDGFVLDETDSGYSPFGGLGWRCLNTRTEVAQNLNTVFDNVISEKECKIKKDDIGSSNFLKCVIIYADDTVSKEIMLKDLTLTDRDVILTLSKNVKVYNKEKIYTKETPPSRLFAVEDPSNVYVELQEDDSDYYFIKDTGDVEVSVLTRYKDVMEYASYFNYTNSLYKTAAGAFSIYYLWSVYNKEGSCILKGTFFTYVNYNQCVQYQGENYFLTQIKFPVSKIDNGSVIYCTPFFWDFKNYPSTWVFSDKNINFPYSSLPRWDDFFKQYGEPSPQDLLSTKKLNFLIKNFESFDVQLIGDNKIYTYASDGSNPTRQGSEESDESFDEDRYLSYAIYFEGRELTQSEYQFIKYKWKLPKENCSLFRKVSSLDSYYDELNKPIISKDDEYIYYEGYGNIFRLYYDLNPKFEEKKKDKKIELIISYNNIEVKKEVNISFIKRDSSQNKNVYTMALTLNGTAYGEKGKPIRWENGVPIFAPADEKLVLFNGEYRYDYSGFDSAITGYFYQIEKNLKTPYYIYPCIKKNGFEIDKLQIKEGDVEYSFYDDPTGENSIFEIKKVNSSEYPNAVQIKLKDKYFSSDGSVSSNLDDLSEWLENGGKGRIIQAKYQPPEASSNISTANAANILYAYYPIETLFNLGPMYSDWGLHPTMDGGFVDVEYSEDGTSPEYKEQDFYINGYQIERALGIPISDLYDIEWTVSGHLGIQPDVTDSSAILQSDKKITSAKGASIRVIPDVKYDDGDAYGSVTAKLSLTEEGYNYIREEYSKYYHQDDCYDGWFRFDFKGFLAGEDASPATFENYFTKYLSRLDDFITNYYNTFYFQWKDFIEDKEKSHWMQLLDEGFSLYKKACASLDKEVNISYLTSFYCQYRWDGLIGDLKNKYGWNYRYDDADYYLAYFERQGDQDEIKKIKDAINFIQPLIEKQKEYLALEKRTEFEEEYTNLQRWEWDGTGPYFYPKPSVLALDKELYTWMFLFNALGCYRTALSVYGSLSKTNFEELNPFSQNNIREYLRNFDLLVAPLTEEDSDGKLHLKSSIKKWYDTEAEKAINTFAGVNFYSLGFKAYFLLIADYAFYKYGEITISRPVVFHYNRDGKSNLSAWDGNKIECGDGAYLTAPQVGAGVRNADNTFTGILMGLRSTSSSTAADNIKQTGLFGYSGGKQSLYLSADTGASIFGIAGNGGQIIIDPRSSSGAAGAIYSGNYFTEEGYDKKTGLPKNVKTNLSGKGMMINFSEPSIKYGSGYFSVDANGNAHIGGGGDGDIGGWYITDTTLHTGNYKSGKNGICLDAANDQISFGSSKGKIFSGEHSTLTNTSNGFYLSQDGLSIGSKAKITNDGTMYLGTGAVNNSSKHWTINGNSSNSYIAYGTTSLGGTSGVYLGTDGIRLGSNFKVTDSGEITATAGNVGGCYIKNGQLDVDRAHISSINADNMYYQDTKVVWKRLSMIEDIDGETIYYDDGMTHTFVTSLDSTDVDDEGNVTVYYSIVSFDGLPSYFSLDITRRKQWVLGAEDGVKQAGNKGGSSSHPNKKDV